MVRVVPARMLRRGGTKSAGCSRRSAAAAGPDPTAGPLDPPALAAMVDRALSDDLAWRYQTADELRDALVEVL